MSSLHEWWSQRTDYVWNVAYSQSHPILRQSRVAIGLCCWFYGLICLLAIATPIVSDHVDIAVIGTFGVSSMVVGCLWIRGPWPAYRHSLLFVAFAEIGVASVLFSIDDRPVALLCAALFGVMGQYVSAYHDTTVFVAHQVWALCTCAGLYALAISYSDADFAQMTAYLIVLVMVLVSSPILTQAYLTFLKRDAAVAHFDPLTGLRNRRGLDSAVGVMADGAAGVAVLVADLDNFKAVNDGFGHSFGDDVLRKTAQAINANFPLPAVTARTGGEEFVVVSAGPLSEMSRAAEALRNAIPACNSAGVTTTSIGIHYREIAIQAVPELLDELLDSADTAMYRAKSHGGNSVEIDVYDGDIRTGS
ncbi:GGDEF domain-containing protein [Rhodococcus sp. 06-156-3C]|uniref:GGDEF domain-containing protein n=1 Tax=Nocardiaceae TaxID=85025 RepID=UPI0005230839|nr:MULTISPECIES: GGDEF domain-containing protein [Rhodococcus]OZD05713.1 GGDEF domain-containing protein [Rhodococcus sp. 06-156-4C]OZD16827.1 GGDEF domain-containing protein [Rhodococcus sp. 06-156-4a]OZD26685.1 GGDEF domain-containing protein [Rhodococcus sp. 06-156-3C]OZD32082.1 GGDEF domain-containing protein [Rhodococcus sp. 06-156-3b]OZD35380.1 GGDEF domain-containing protein [Rhodococcus sp. 06-156-3]